MTVSISENLPQGLIRSGYCSNGEYAWPRSEAIEVAGILKDAGAAVLGVEVWLPTVPGPTIPGPYIYTWTSDARQPFESWDAFAYRASDGARAYIESFTWHHDDEGNRSSVPYFNLTAATEIDLPAPKGS